MMINKRKSRMIYKAWPNFCKLKIYPYKINIPNLQKHEKILYIKYIKIVNSKWKIFVYILFNMNIHIVFSTWEGGIELKMTIFVLEIPVELITK